MIKRLFALIFLSLIILLSVLGLNYLFKPGSFPIKQIVMVNKLDELDPGHLQQLISYQMNGGFFSLDINQLRKDIETLSWIDTVSVRKKWPDMIYVDIQEKKVSARWLVSDNNTFTINKLKQQSWNKENLISDKAVIFTTTLTPAQQLKFEQLAIYSAPDNSSAEGLKKCQSISRKMKKSQLKILRCFQDQRRSWFIELDNGFELYLGQQKNRANKNRDNIIRRIDVFLSAYKQIFKKYEKMIDRIDMRYSNGFAIKWKPVEKRQDLNLTAFVNNK